MTPLIVLGRTQTRLTLPDDYRQVATLTERRNQEVVTIERYQANGPARPFAPHISLVYGQDQRLISFNDAARTTTGPLPATDTALAIALATFQALDPQYAAALQFMRIDRQSRDVHDATGQRTAVSLLWVKFAHPNGSYNWVSVSAQGRIVEVERESYWDYRHNRRLTEEWNYDAWVLARRGQGPKPAAPEALA
ncbi:hypothetical protein [Lacticaseibacillus absianus]|uniref:hypothetical protein n=1 Tax=Lacticaseibacillus absianus TaxID=2729623 RepID=UPI0015CC8BE8|nr:hypothetical protein [Lacticaseibacillus absianus]